MEGGKKEKSMFKIFKSTLQILVAVALVLQLGGCIFMGWDRHGHPYHHDHDHDWALMYMCMDSK